MSFVFGKGKSSGRGKITKGGSDTTKKSVTQKNVKLGHRTVKYVELYDVIATGALGAGLSGRIIDYEIPKGHAAELFAVGIQPDFLAGASNMLDTEIGFDRKLTGIKYKTNHLGLNALPFGDRLSKQPMRLLDYPLKSGNLTVKYNEGMKVQIVATMNTVAANLSAIRACAKIYLLEEADVKGIYGKSISDIATLPGGVSQAIPENIFAEYEGLETATLGDGKWNDLYSKSITDYEEISITHIGVDGASLANADAARLFDSRQKVEFPEYDPWWKINASYNRLVFGDDDDEAPMYKVPKVVTDHVFTNTTMSLRITDLSLVIPIVGITAQLIGRYRRVR